jgi:hypothetical protein
MSLLWTSTCRIYFGTGAETPLYARKCVNWRFRLHNSPAFGIR